MLNLCSHRYLLFSKRLFSCINHQNISKNRHVLCLASQNPIIFMRKTSTLPEKSESATLPIFEKFGKDIMNIYRFPYIAYCNWVVNLKWYVMPITCVCAYSLVEAATAGTLDPDSLDYYVLGLSLFTLKSFLWGLPFRNFVSHIFITPKEDIVLSYVDFYGARIDEKFPKGDLSLQSRETGRFKFITRDSLYMLIISKSTKKIFRINFRYGDMFDEDLFRSTIGVIPDSI